MSHQRSQHSDRRPSLRSQSTRHAAVGAPSPSMLPALLAVAILAAGLTFGSVSPASAAATVTGRNGLSMATAGASCWGIHEEFPAAPDGTYWLVTTQLAKPQQFYCDMTSDGGGWVLIGRGRQGWTFDRNGQNSATQVRTVPNGTAAFVPATLGTDTINGLMNGGRTSDLVDGIRVRRAANAGGTSWQELRLKVSNHAGWSWAFGGGVQLTSTTVDSVTYDWGNTRDSAHAWAGQPVNGLTGVNDERRLMTYPQSSHGGQAGFGYGSTMVGTNDSTSYLWQFSTERYAIPFAQVFLRPRIGNDAPVESISADGLPAVQKPWSLKQRPEPATWGVVGASHVGETVGAEPWATPVLAMKVLGDRVYVGGRFTGVQQGPTGVPIAQSFLAAFDRRTGDWIDTFRPVLDGRVWDLALAPSGRLIVAGDFLSANGAPNTTGLAMLDATTGASVTTWKANLRRESTTGDRAIARSLAVSADAVYVGGRFTHVKGGTWGEIRVSNATKVKLTDGSPMTSWAVNVPAMTARMALSPQGDRIHLVGYFDRVNGNTAAAYFATLSTSTGAVLPGQGAFQSSVVTGKKYQLAVAEVGDTVVEGGSEHNLQQYRRSDRTLLRSHITVNGGDTQAIATVNGQIFASCHCFGWTYQWSNSWSVPMGYTRVDPINGLGWYDPVTFEYKESFHPSSLRSSTSSDGIWTMDSDTDNCLWFGGDIIGRGYSGNAAADWMGNFGRFCPEDQTVPTAPEVPAATSAGTSVTLKWAPSTDVSGVPEYWIYRNGRVVGTTTGTSFTDTGRVAATTYSIRAVDAAGNQSASTPPQTVVPFGEVLLPTGSDWRWSYPDVSPPVDWNTAAFSDAAWPVGRGELGYGEGDEATVLTIAPTPRPVTAYFRRDVTVLDPSAYTSFAIDVIRDDGVAVYVNGVEVCRNNLPGGPLLSTTPASAVVSSRTDEITPIRCEVPSGLIVAGTNLVTAEVHNSDRWSSDLSFDLRLGGRR